MKLQTAVKVILRFLTGSIIVLTLLPFGAFAGEALDWPRIIETEKGKITVYQPQLESFSGDRLNARAAVSVTLKDKNVPVFGAVWIKARVATDRNARTITLLEIDVTDSRFPGATEKQLAELEKRLERAIPKWTPTTSLDRILAIIEN